MHGGRKRDNGHTLRQELFRLDIKDIKENLFLPEDSVAQRGCEVSVLGGFQDLALSKQV